MRNAECGLWAVLAASLLGLLGFAEKRAEGGVITSLDAIPGAEQRGGAATVSQGGNLVWVERSGDAFPTTRPSGIAFNAGGRGHTLFAGHSAFNIPNPTFKIGTGSNFVTDPGLIFTASSYNVFPGYTGTGSLGTAIDAAWLTFDVEIPNAPELVFASQPLAPGQTVQLAGFGTLGVFNSEYLGQTGAAYSGQSSLGGSLLLGANPDWYSRVSINPFDPNGYRGAQFDSGGWVFGDENGIRVTYGMITQGSSSISGLATQFVRFDQQNTVFQDFYSSNITAVPEPSSLFLAGAGAFAILRRIRKSRNQF